MTDVTSTHILLMQVNHMAFSEFNKAGMFNPPAEGIMQGKEKQYFTKRNVIFQKEI